MLKEALAFLMMLTGGALNPQGLVKPTDRWIAYYDKNLPADAFRDYALIVFDGEHHPDFASLKEGRTILAYLSLGEVHGHDPMRAALEKRGAILGKNAQWGSEVVDIRDPEWRAHLLEKTIPALLERGFDGIMIDTVDSPLQYEASQPEQYAGMSETALAFIRAARLRFPEMKIMLNRGFTLLPEAGRSIDYALVESLVSNPDKTMKKMDIWPNTTQRRIVDILQQARVKHPDLRVYSLDYWDMADETGVNAIYHMQRERGFIPYVATQDLRTAHQEPGHSRPVDAQSGTEEKRMRHA
jgi:uncharacterized protein (TIGR01370 family)